MKVRTKPVQPSQREIEEHEVSHYPYRNWCRYCVAAKGRRDKHASVSENTAKDVVCIVYDYGFFTSREDEGKPEEELEKKYTPFLAIKDDETETVFADVVHRKGVEDWSVKVCVDHVVELGHPKVTLRSDGENPIKALLGQVAAELKRKGVTAATRHVCMLGGRGRRVQCRRLWAVLLHPLPRLWAGHRVLRGRGTG